jgi:hypothetical protein
MKYYHIVKFDRKIIASILKDGLKANEDGEIFLFENKSIQINGVKNFISDHIACNQIFVDEYVMFEIDSEGFNTDLIPDNVAEFAAKWQWILKQHIIEPRFIEIFGKYKTKFKNFYTD